MNEQWDALSRIFTEAMELPSAQRGAFVAAECGGDAALRSHVERLLCAEEQAGTWLDRTAVGPLSGELLLPGDVLCGRFSVRRKIAAGGMGAVYEAFDEDLRTEVAIKVIRPDIAHDAEVVERFRREVALARRITSRHVCRTFDLERTTHAGRDLVFLTMEFLPGVTLAERLREHGALSSDEALSIASAVAEALDAAHSLGVVHRDVKPGNVMLSDGGRVVVTDFGLARLSPQPWEDSADGLTRTGLPMGTLSYMAPEQLDGRPVTPATDVYALALVIVEMLSGQRLYAGANPLSGMAQRLTQPARLSMLPPSAPAGWSGALQRALSPAPEDRQSSAGMLLRDLQRSVASPRMAAVRSRTGKLFHRRVWLPLLALLALVALSAAALRLLQVRTDTSLPQGATVFLAPMENSTGDRSLDHAGLLLQTELSQSARLRLLPDSRVASVESAMKRPAGALLDAPAAREIALRAGAGRVLLGRLSRDGSHYSLTMTVEQPDNDPRRARRRWKRTFPWTGDPGKPALGSEAVAALRDAGSWVRGLAGESADDIARLDVPPEDATTDNWQALEEYARADSLLRADRSDDGILALQRATQLDPQFSLAFARLGDTLSARDRWQEGLAAYRQAMSGTGRQRLTRREMDRVRGIYASDTGDYATAEAQFRDMASFYPDDWLAWFYRGLPLMRLGRTAEAAEVLRQAHSLAPANLSPGSGLAEAALQSGDTVAAAAWIKQVRATGFESMADWMEGVAAIASGDAATARAKFERVRDLPAQRPGTVVGWQSLERLAAEEGKTVEALADVNSALPLAAAHGDAGKHTSLLLDRAWLECRTGAAAACVDDAAAALRADGTSRQQRLVDGLAIRFAPGANAATRAAFRRVLQTRPAVAEEMGPLFDAVRLETEAAIALADGNCAAAVRSLRAAATVDAPADSRQNLAMGLEVCAARTAAQDGAARDRAAAMRREAAEAYAVSAFSAPLVWNVYREHPPAAFADQLAGWLRTTDNRGGRYRSAAAEMERLRPHEFTHGVSVRTPPTVH